MCPKMEYVLFLCLIVCGVDGTLRLPHSYGNHMVLQRGPERAILWGYSDVVGDTVVVLKNDVKVAETVVVQNPSQGPGGKWKVKLPAETSVGPFVFKITSSEGTVILSDVMYGDVWVCSGQSNMQFKMSEVFNSAHEIDDSIQYRNIRMLFSRLLQAATPQDDVIVDHPWIYPVKGIIDNFSALCFMFAREIQKDLQYPIGLIESNWGGTPIEVWSSPSAISSCPTNVKPSPSQYWPTDAGVLWNSMIKPFISMTIKGAIWYQGESNSGQPTLYACQFPAMITDWRKKFHDASDGETSLDFPFGFVQLAPYRDGDVASGFPATRWAQTTDIGYVPNANMPNTFMAVAIDLPDFVSPSGSIHPRYKQDIAIRLALGARHIAYKETTVKFQGPFPTMYQDNPGQHTLTVTFDNGTANLQVNNNNGFQVCCGATVSACGNDASWVAAPIKGTHTSSVEIDTSVCHGNYHALGLRYLWKESPCALHQCALYSRDTHLPVPPFTKTGLSQTNPGIVG